MPTGSRRTDEADVGSMPPVALDRFIQSKLKTRRLVGEYPFEGPVFERTKQLVEAYFLAQPANADRVHSFANTHPALYAYYLAGIGAHSGRGGELWTFVPFVSQRPELRAAAGQAFEHAVKRNSLTDASARMKRERHLRYVGQVMFHAIVPKESAQPLLERVSRLLNEGVVNGAELRRALLSVDRNNDLTEPVLRFLRYGDDLAEDYLNRLALLLRASARDERVAARTFGLPHYIDEVLLKVDKPRSLAAVSTVPRPKILFDPWTGTGPELVLPATGKIDNWVLRDGFGQRSFPSSLYQERAIPLPVATRWVVEGRKGDELINRLGIESFSGGVFLFSLEDGRPITSRLWIGDELVALVPNGSDLMIGDRKLPNSDRYAPLSGDWSGYSVVDVDLEEHSELHVMRVTARHNSDKPAATELVLRRGSADQRAALLGDPIPSVLGLGDTPVYDGFPMLRIPRGDDPERWFVSFTVNNVPCETIRVSQLLRVEKALGLGDNIWALGRTATIPLVSHIELRVSGPLGGDLDERFLIVSGLAYRPPNDVVGPNEVFVSSISADDRVRLGESGSNVLEFQTGADLLTLTASVRQASAELQFKIPRLMWAIGDEIATERFDAVKASMQVHEFLEAKPTLWVNTGIETDVRVVLRDNGGTEIQRSKWFRTSPRTGRLRVDLRQFRDTVRHTSDPMLVFQVETKSACGIALEIPRDYKVRDFGFILNDVDARARFTELEPMNSRVVLLWDLLRPWNSAIELPIPDGVDGSEYISLGRVDLPPSSYIAQLTQQSKEAVYPDNITSNMVPFDVMSQARPNALNIKDIIADFPTRDKILATRTESESMRLASHALQAIVTLADSTDPLGGPLHRECVKHCVETLFDDPARLVEAIVAKHQTGRLGERTARLAVLQLITGACDVPLAEGSLSDRLGTDLWEVSPVLAAAVDRPTTDSSIARWKRHLGWTPADGPIFPGKLLDESVLTRSVESLRNVHTRCVNSGTKLLQSSGFREAVIRWLLVSAGDFSPTRHWQERQKTLLSLPKNRWPTDARQTHAALSRGSNPLLRLPADLLAISLQLVCFTDSDRLDPFARTALTEAFEFAPRLVERQLVLALVYHLRDIGSLKVGNNAN